MSSCSTSVVIQVVDCDSFGTPADMYDVGWEPAVDPVNDPGVLVHGAGSFTINGSGPVAETNLINDLTGFFVFAGYSMTITVVLTRVDCPVRVSLVVNTSGGDIGHNWGLLSTPQTVSHTFNLPPCEVIEMIFQAVAFGVLANQVSGTMAFAPLMHP